MLLVMQMQDDFIILKGISMFMLQILTGLEDP